MLADDMIYLRKLEEADLDRTWHWINQPDIYTAMGTLVPISKTAQKRWFEELDSSNAKIVFAICLHDGDQHVGNVSLDLIDYRHRNARLAIFIADADLRDQGIGTRAMHLLIEYAFDLLNLHRLYCKTTAGNPAVLEFYRRLGFRMEGQLREHEYVEGRYVDKIMLGLLRGDVAQSDESTS
jgi:UDP-4-amino-4,6-dideoxy-N-acetyl-beta-L-altrosamine N-acetyltransferase